MIVGIFVLTKKTLNMSMICMVISQKKCCILMLIKTLNIKEMDSIKLNSECIYNCIYHITNNMIPYGLFTSIYYPVARDIQPIQILVVLEW